MASNKPNSAPEKFIRRLQKAMDEHPQKLSLNQVARQADLSPAYLSFLLNGKRNVPSNDAIQQLARVLLIPLDELFNAAGKPNDAALQFFRKEGAGPIMRNLARVPDNQLGGLAKLIERFVKRQQTTRK